MSGVSHRKMFLFWAAPSNLLIQGEEEDQEEYVEQDGDEIYDEEEE